MPEPNEQPKPEKDFEQPETGEVMPDQLAPRDLPAVTLESLAQLRPGDYLQNLGDLTQALRKVSIMQTEPEDWVLFRRPGQDGEEGRVTAYLQDAGCQRIMGMWKIEVMPSQGRMDFEREQIAIEGTEDFAWVTRGNGICKLWAEPQTLYNIEGVRRSDEDFVKYKKGIQKSIEVRKASFANLNGSIVRRLTGLGGVAVRLLDEVWKLEGRGKTSANCARGKGYGTQAERLGEARDVEYGDPPKCPTCQRKMVLRHGKKGPFWGCPGYPKCEQKPIDAKPIPQTQSQAQEPEGAEPEPKGKAENGNQELGKHKWQLQEKLTTVKDQKWAKETLKLVLAAKTENELLDIETTIKDKLEGGAK